MDYRSAVTVLGDQSKNLRKVNGASFVRGEYEYRVTWCGGFACYVGIDRRLVGKRNYKYFGGVKADRCRTVGDVMSLVMEMVGRG